MNKMENINRTAKYFSKKKKCRCRCSLDWKLLQICYVKYRYPLISQNNHPAGLTSYTNKPLRLDFKVRGMGL